MTTVTTTVSTPSLAPPILMERVRVARVMSPSPSFRRLELAGPALADLGVDGRYYDQRIKLVLPPEGGPLPSMTVADDSWYTDWLARPVDERGHMRTYTIRDVLGEGEQTRLVVDIVVHGEGHGDLSGGSGGPAHGPGPGAAWAARAQVGDEVLVLAPRRGSPYGGIEWAPRGADQVLLVGDETAVPAIASILEDLVADASTLPGAAFLEVPLAADVTDLVVPTGIEVTWVVRGRSPYGERLHAAVLAHLGQGAAARPELDDAEVDPDLWETPDWSSSGAVVAPGSRPAQTLDGLYAWIAGEAKTVTGLRRALVRDLGMDRRQVAFMGYWRQGVAMKS